MIELTEDQKIVQDTVRRLAREKIAPRAAEIDADDEFAWDIAEQLAQVGLLNVLLPEKYGGADYELLTLCLVVDEIAQVSGTVSMVVVSQATPLVAMMLKGTEKQKSKYVPMLADSTKIWGIAITEPGAGSDVLSMRTRAVADGDDFVINGNKIFITSGNIADLIILIAVTDGSASRRSKALSAFIVEPKASPGFKVGKLEHKMGMRGCPLAELVFQDMRVPRGNMLGAPGDGFYVAMQSLDRMRAVVAAQGVGIAQGALDYAVEYAKQRIQFGKPIASFQGIQFLLADLGTRVVAARLLSYQAAYMVDHKVEKGNMYSAMAKCFATDVAMEVTTNAVQILGGAGYMRDHPVERMMRDAKATQIFEGANHIQRLVIARNLVGRFD